jgi:DNA-binding IclR family transcriptional regulator
MQRISLFKMERQQIFRILEFDVADKATSETVGKALTLLIDLANAGIEGAPLGDIAADADLPKPTTHRLLTTLALHGFVERAPNSRRYRIGPALSAIARRTSAVDLQAGRWRASLTEIAHATDDAAFLMIRSGDDALCIDACFGAHMIPTLTSGVGGRSPLGLGPGSVVILAALEDDEVRAILARNAPRLRLTPTRDLAAILARVVAARRTGMDYDPGEFMPEVAGLAVAIAPDGKAAPMALSIASLASRMRGAAVDAAAARLRAAVRAVSGAAPLSNHT